jgi:hypothetical protein
VWLGCRRETSACSRYPDILRPQAKLWQQYGRTSCNAAYEDTRFDAAPEIGSELANSMSFFIRIVSFLEGLT